MDPNEFEPNSQKYRMEKSVKESEGKKIEKVISGNATTRKKSLFRRFANTFFYEDIGDVKTYLIYDVIVPAIKENIVDLINSAAGMIFFGEARRRPAKNSSGGNSKINYGGYFAGNERKEKLPNYSRSRATHNFDDVIFETYGEADAVLDSMIEILNSEYKQVTVADFYDLAGLSTNFTDNKFGWIDLRGASVKGSPHRGYYIDLPRCISLA